MCETATIETEPDNVVFDVMSPAKTDAFVLGREQPPWESKPFQLVSWWSMQKFSADIFYSIGRYLNNLVNELAKVPADLQADGTDEKGKAYKTLEGIRVSCEKVGLSVSAKCVKNLLAQYRSGTTIGRFVEGVSHLGKTIKWEMEEKLFMFIPTDRAPFYNQPELFGKNVNSKFPGIQFDMVEAGNCYAAGRSTAAVFHLMRIMEVGVQEFGKKLGVSLVNVKNWQNTLDETNKAIKSLNPKNPNTVEMSQASANLYAVKLAWRNEVMHPKDTYTPEEAHNLIAQVRLFMEHLATII